MDFTKVLNFVYSDLRKDGYLIFVFDDVEIMGKAIYEDFNPVVWKAVHLQAGGDYQFTEEYHHQLALVTAYIEQGIVMTSSAVRDIQYGQETTLTGSKETGYHWSVPKTVVDIPKGRFTAKNETGDKQNIAVSIHPRGGFAEHLLFMKLQNDATLEVKFTPRLRIYSVREMKGGSIVKAKAVSPALWDYDLSDNELPDNWVITEDSPGDYVITPCE